MIGKTLVLYGSPKGMHGSSASIADYIADRMEQLGVSVERIGVYHSIKDEEGLSQLVRAFSSADLVLLCFPLYIDTLPAGVLVALNHIWEQKEFLTTRRRMFAAACNCGFPEAFQNEVALESCKHFAAGMNMEFGGGMAIGEGGMLSDVSLKDFRFAKSHNLLFDQAAKCLADGKSIPNAVLQDLRRPFVPPRLYSFFANRGWNSMARKNGVKSRIKEGLAD